MLHFPCESGLEFGGARGAGRSLVWLVMVWFLTPTTDPQPEPYHFFSILPDTDPGLTGAHMHVCLMFGERNFCKSVHLLLDVRCLYHGLSFMSYCVSKLFGVKYCGVKVYFKCCFVVDQRSSPHLLVSSRAKTPVMEQSKHY